MPTHVFETILVPMDFSDISAHALQTASLLRERCGHGTLMPMYANWFEAPPYFTSGRLEELQREFRESLRLAEESLTGLVHSTLGAAADAAKVRVVEALPADGVREVAVLQNADLIVMGTHGRSGLNRWMLGSVAERVLREGPVRVLTVSAAPQDRIERVLCPVHDTDLSRRALKLAAESVRVSKHP
jgi:nucleotide-binding universal stress UspA family protein